MCPRPRVRISVSLESAVRGVYYVRILEIARPRWSTYDAAKLRIALCKDSRTPEFLQTFLEIDDRTDLRSKTGLQAD